MHKRTKTKTVFFSYFWKRIHVHLTILILDTCPHRIISSNAQYTIQSNCTAPSIITHDSVSSQFLTMTCKAVKLYSKSLGPQKNPQLATWASCEFFCGPRRTQLYIVVKVSLQSMNHSYEFPHVSHFSHITFSSIYALFLKDKLYPKS